MLPPVFQSVPTQSISPQSISLLRYRLVTALPGLEPLQILIRREFDWRGGRAAACVLGASHAVSWQSHDDCFTEMLTCHPESDSTASVIAECSADAPSEIQANSKTLRCRIQITQFELTSRRSALNGFYDADHLLCHLFPSSTPGESPLTCLGWQAAPERLTIETLHTYPETGQGVRSLSVFEPLSLFEPLITSGQRY